MSSVGSMPRSRFEAKKVLRFSPASRLKIVLMPVPAIEPLIPAFAIAPAITNICLAASVLSCTPSCPPTLPNITPIVAALYFVASFNSYKPVFDTACTFANMSAIYSGNSIILPAAFLYLSVALRPKAVIASVSISEAAPKSIPPALAKFNMCGVAALI